MSLIETNLISITKKQLFYKIKAHLGLFNGLVAVQLIAFLLSFGRVGSSGIGNGSINLNITWYSNDAILAFTFVWIFATAILFSTREFRNADFTFASNRLSSNLSNIGFLLLASVIAGVTASLFGVVIRLMIYFTQGSHNIIGKSFFLAPQELLLGCVATALYMILVSALGYLIGILAHYSKFIIPLLAVFFIGSLFVQVTNKTIILKIISNLVLSFVNESSLILFAVKIVVAGLIFFTASILISNRTEVRQ